MTWPALRSKMSRRRESQIVAKTKWVPAALISLVACVSLALSGAISGPAKTDIQIEGLLEPVEIIKDKWGISHIYAQNPDDLFFAQGFNVASDRLFQLEMWRRQATGTAAEILGEKALRRDIGARLLKFRGDLQKELNSYHPQGERIVSRFVEGINAYIDLTQKDAGLLPVEFRLLGITPGRWTTEVVVSRHNGLFRNATTEVRLARAVRAIGPEKVKELLDLHPGNPDLRPPDGLDLSAITDKVTDLYKEAREPLRFAPENIVALNARAPALAERSTVPLMPFLFEPIPQLSQGSNNWAVSGRLTRSGFPFLANDPHRDLQIPSLRYWVHLTAPGWNVIGGGEPALPGVSIGHNDQGAWGLTIFSADQEDLYVYKTDPRRPERYRYSDGWEEMTVVSERIPVKGAGPFGATLKFTRHGPVIYEDPEHHMAVALRAAWLETGCAPYLASLRIDQAKTWPEFREACFRNRTPSENMIWADRDGNVGWQATGLVPIRPNWPGLLPVPGDGRYEWAGQVPASELPSILNPASGFIATANQDNIPEGYPYQVGYLWAYPFRFQRIAEVLGSSRAVSLPDMKDLQQDVLSLPARRLVPLLKDLKTTSPLAQKAMEMLDEWDFILSPESGAAAVFIAWERALLENWRDFIIPPAARSVLEQPSLLKAISWLGAEGDRSSPASQADRNRLLIQSFDRAVERLAKEFGPDPAHWQYGGPRFHHVRFDHPLSGALREDLRRQFDLGPFPRGGDGETVNNTSGSDNQDSGATFRIIADLADWDLSVGTNAPGQSGIPGNPHYADLLKPWIEGGYFPVYFSRAKIESAAEKTVLLAPLRPRR
jgi:penicillin G amidase